MKSALSDAELALEIRSESNREAEAELFRRMAPRIRLYGLRHLRDKETAADLTQEVLVTTLAALREGRLREPEKLPSFVLGTCRLTVLEMRRSGSRREQLLDQFGADMLTSLPTTLPEIDRQQLASCVQSLGERERHVIVMSFYDEQTGAELAESMGIPEAHLRVIRHRALDQLCDCIGVAQ